MKRVMSMMLLLSWILCGCASDFHPVTRDEIVSAYSEAGYTVSSVHGNIVVQYDDPAFYAVFEELLKSK